MVIIGHTGIILRKFTNRETKYWFFILNFSYYYLYVDCLNYKIHRVPYTDHKLILYVIISR